MASNDARAAITLTSFLYNYRAFTSRIFRAWEFFSPMHTLAVPDSHAPATNVLAKPSPLFWSLLAIDTLLHIPFASPPHLAPDEAVYWAWSRRLALGSLDPPPMVAYLIRLGTSVFGSNET